MRMGCACCEGLCPVISSEPFAASILSLAAWKARASKPDSWRLGLRGAGLCFMTLCMLTASMPPAHTQPYCSCSVFQRLLPSARLGFYWVTVMDGQAHGCDVRCCNDAHDCILQIMEISVLTSSTILKAAALSKARHKGWILLSCYWWQVMLHLP